MITLSFYAASHSGRTAADGCHYCRTKCEEKGYKSGERHCHGENEKASAKRKKYRRSEFRHWIDTDKDCQNTRAEILISRSLIDVTFKNKKKCSVVSGKWKDFYYPETLLLAKDADIDHVVSLKDAWESGASKWSSKKRTQFANDLDNLIITNKRYNRQKGAQTPLTWTPLNKNYSCKYMKRWVFIKKKYKLDIDPQIYENLKQAKCNS